MTHPIGPTIETQLTQDENGQPVIAWREVSEPEAWARVDKDGNVTHLDMDLCAKGPHNAYTALALAIWNKAIEEAAKYAVGDGDDVLAALAEPEEDHELSAALGWAAGISEPALDRKALLRRVAEIAQDMQAKTKRAWDVGYDCGIKAASERRLSDSEIGEIWFAAKIPGLTETQARVLIRAAEKMMRGEIQ